MGSLCPFTLFHLFTHTDTQTHRHTDRLRRLNAGGYCTTQGVLGKGGRGGGGVAGGMGGETGDLGGGGGGGGIALKGKF